MNYLSQYYKNLAEQLQEKINCLTQLLEAENRLYPKRFETEEDQYIKDQEDAQKNKVKNSTKQEQSDRLSDDILKGAVIAPGTATGLGALGTIALTGVETALEGSASTEPLAIVGAKALGAGGAGYMAGKAIKVGMDYFDPEQKTYAKIGSVLTGGPEQVERRGAPATQAEYTQAAKEAAARRKARYGSEDDRGELVAVPRPAPRMPPDVGRYGPVRPPLTIPAPKN